MAVTVSPPEAEGFDQQVRACAREIAPLCDRLAPRYHPRVIQAALLMAGADVMARHISWGYLQPWLARRFLLRAWRHALAGCQWWQRVPYGWTLGAGVIIIAIISFVLSACGRPVQIVPNTTTVADLVEIAADVSDNIQRDGTWIEYELWLEDFCKLPAAERSALARQAGRAEPNCAVLRRGRAQ